MLSSPVRRSTSPGAALIQFDNVGMRYGPGPEILRDVSFRIAAGAFRFITGPSGAGKTSLLRLLYLAHRPSRGLITLFGRDVATMPRGELPGLRRRIGVVFQGVRLLDHLTVRENVLLPLLISGMAGEEALARVEELLRWIGLGDRMDARPPTLAGGEQQRVAIARAVANAPLILLADEPTGNLDPATASYVFEALEALVRQSGLSALIATHNHELAARMDRRVTLADGKIVDF